MNKVPIKNRNASYKQMEEKANEYFNTLCVQVRKKKYVSTLIEDFQSWEKNHIPSIAHSFLSFGKRKATSKGYQDHIKWLDYTGNLERYLDRSISYIYMRDLGKSLDSMETQKSIQKAVSHLKEHLIKSDNNRGKKELYNIAGLYRWAQKENIETTIIWLINKLKTVSDNIPKGMNAEHARRKLIKIIAGVMMHQLEEMEEDVSPEVRIQKLDEAIRLGYSYGLTYPFIDDLLDSKILSPNEQQQYSDLIRTTLRSGVVPELKKWTGKNEDLIRYVHLELKEAFEYIKAHQHPETQQSFFEQAYIFFESQEIDRTKQLFNDSYSNEEIYVPTILKSSSSRLITRSIISAPKDEGFDNRTFFYGIYNQLADDFADMFEDMKNGAVTPYTYYMKYHEQRTDLINPFELYWAVISNLIHNVYQSDSKTSEVILNRAINGLIRFKARIGTNKYKEVMKVFTSEDSVFIKTIEKMVRKAENVDFFDKLLRDEMVTILKEEQKDQEDFLEKVENARNQINNSLPITQAEKHEPIIDAANYSLEGSAKRLRPIVTWMMSDEYGLNKEAIVPLIRSLEYMHTASLIFDDLPSQDNAAIRRGRPTLHDVYDVATAELTGLFLTQKAIEEQTSLEKFDAKTVLSLIQYSARTTEEMCKGQAMDLNSKGKRLSLERLKKLYYYKTGIAFEASLIMPAILAKVTNSEKDALKHFSYHAGIAFQIKDDLLDLEGDRQVIGKPVGKDAENNKFTIVSILGKNNARKTMWEHYCLAIEALQEVPRNTSFLKHLLNYMVNRDR